MTTVAPPRVLSDVDEQSLRRLTRSSEKVDQYLVDPHYRTGEQLISAADAKAATFVVLKPEAVAGRRIEMTLQALRDNGFVVVSAQIFRFTSLLFREIWRYQFNVATQDRIDVVDLILPSSESLLLILRDSRFREDDDSCLPASCRLAGLKGPADPAARKPGDLRSILRGPTTLFNFMHTADEPADVIRELAMLDLFTEAPATAAVRFTEPADPDRLAGLVDHLYRALPEHDLDATASRKRLASSGYDAVAELAAQPDCPGWRDLVNAFPGGRIPPDALWDVLSLATAQLQSNVPGLSPIIPTVGASSWTTVGQETS